MGIRSDQICSELAEQGAFVAYLESELSPDEETRFIQHLDECENCARHLQLITGTHEKLLAEPESLHPSGDEIYYLASGIEQDPYVASHVERCKSCRHELEVLKDHILKDHTESIEQKSESFHSLIYGTLLELLNIPKYIAHQLKKAPALSLGVTFAAIIVAIMLYPWQSYMAPLLEQGINFGKNAPNEVKDSNEVPFEDKELKKPLEAPGRRASGAVTTLEKADPKQKLGAVGADRPTPPGKSMTRRAETRLDRDKHSHGLKNNEPTMSLRAPEPISKPSSQTRAQENEAKKLKARQGIGELRQSAGSSIKSSIKPMEDPIESAAFDKAEPKTDLNVQAPIKEHTIEEELQLPTSDNSWGKDKDNLAAELTRQPETIPVRVELHGPQGSLLEESFIVLPRDLRSEYELIVITEHKKIKDSPAAETEELDRGRASSKGASLETVAQIRLNIVKNKSGYQINGKLTSKGEELASVDHYGIQVDDLKDRINKVVANLLRNYDGTRHKPTKNRAPTSAP